MAETCLAAVQIELLLVTADALIQTKHFEMPFHRLGAGLVVAPAFMAAFPWNTLLVDIEE